MLEKKNKSIVVSLFALSVILIFLSGCSKSKIEIKKVKENTAFKNNITSTELISTKSSDKVLAAIINKPSKQEMNNAKKIWYLTLDEEGSSVFIIPTYNGSNVKISEVELKGTELVEKGTVFEKENTEDGFAILAEVFRPEGIPRHKVTIEFEGEKAEYLISYNGKEGNPHIEFILSSEKKVFKG